MKQMTFTSRPEQTETAAAFVETALGAEGCPMKVVMKLNIVFDELFSNIVRYSGATRVQVDCGVADGWATLALSDDGQPYDPTRATAPDTSLSADERDIGGLGIHMARKLTDEMTYLYRDNRNVLIVRKKLT